MHFTVNEHSAEVELDSRTSLLDLLRERLDFTGTKKGCDQGACGACTVLVEGERILPCLALAVQYEGRKITTVEGLAEGNALHALQCLHRSRRTSVRLLHAGTDLFGDRHGNGVQAGRELCQRRSRGRRNPDARRAAGTDERHFRPLRRL